jgi:hypothetical protein
MPTSRKRKKKEVVQVETMKTANIVKHPIGKAVIILLSFGFVLSLIVGLIYTLVTVMNDW